MTLASGGNRILLFVVHQPVCLFIWPAVPSLQHGLSTNPGVVNVVHMWMQLKRLYKLCVLQRGQSGDGCDLASTLCKYDLRKDDLFVLSWARVRRERQGSISSELLMCSGGVHSILLLPLVARCLETIDVSIWRMFVVMPVVVSVGVCRNVLALEC